MLQRNQLFTAQQHQMAHTQINDTSLFLCSIVHLPGWREAVFTWPLLQTQSSVKSHSLCGKKVIPGQLLKIKQKTHAQDKYEALGRSRTSFDSLTYPQITAGQESNCFLCYATTRTRALALTRKNQTLWSCWMQGRLLKKGLGLICCKDEKYSRLKPENEDKPFHWLLSRMS